MENTDVMRRNRAYIDRLIRQSELTQSINRKIEYLELAARVESKNITGELINNNIENRIKEISSQISQIVPTMPLKNEVLHIITRCYEKGGHTRLLNLIIQTDIEHKHSVCIVNPENLDKLEWLKKSCKESGGEVFKIVGKDRLQKVVQLNSILQEYKYVFCYLHPWDVVSSIAIVRRNSDSKVYFYNHCDHIFNVGVTCSDYVIDMSEEGAFITNSYRCENKSIVLPIPIIWKEQLYSTNAIDLRKKLGIKSDKKVVLTIASEEKYKENKTISFETFVDKLLVNKNIVIVIVGPNPIKRRWKKLKKKYKDNICFTGILNKTEYENIFSIADCYVDSIPMDSATCTLDALMNRIPSYSLRIPEAYVDELSIIKCSNLDNLLNRVKNSLDGFTDYNINSVMISVKANHCNPAWKLKMKKVLFSPQDLKTRGRYAFDIEDYYKYMLDIYIGKKFNINRADLQSFDKKVLLDFIRIIKFDFLIGIIYLLKLKIN